MLLSLSRALRCHHPPPPPPHCREYPHPGKPSFIVSLLPAAGCRNLRSNRGVNTRLTHCSKNKIISPNTSRLFFPSIVSPIRRLHVFHTKASISNETQKQLLGYKLSIITHHISAPFTPLFHYYYIYPILLHLPIMHVGTEQLSSRDSLLTVDQAGEVNREGEKEVIVFASQEWPAVLCACSQVYATRREPSLGLREVTKQRASGSQRLILLLFLCCVRVVRYGPMSCWGVAAPARHRQPVAGATGSTTLPIP